MRSPACAALGGAGWRRGPRARARTHARRAAVAGTMQAVRQKWTLLKTYRRIQALWDEYKKVVNTA